MADMEKDVLAEKLGIFMRTGGCPVCGYAGKNTRDWETGVPFVISHKDFARDYQKLEKCEVAEAEEAKNRVG
jgi:hypothetical protein